MGRFVEVLKELDSKIQSMNKTAEELKHILMGSRSDTEDRMFRLEITQNSAFEVIEFTESELDNRLIAIYKLVRWGLPDREGMFLENAKNILLHGTEKEE